MYQAGLGFWGVFTTVLSEGYDLYKNQGKDLGDTWIDIQHAITQLRQEEQRTNRQVALTEMQTKQIKNESELRLKIAEAEERQNALIGAIDARNAARVAMVAGGAVVVLAVIAAIRKG